MPRNNEPRLAQLRRAQIRLSEKVAADPDSPKAEALRARLAEYDVSIARLNAGERHECALADPSKPIGANVRGI